MYYQISLKTTSALPTVRRRRLLSFGGFEKTDDLHIIHTFNTLPTWAPHELRLQASFLGISIVSLPRGVEEFCQDQDPPREGSSGREIPAMFASR